MNKINNIKNVLAIILFVFASAACDDTLDQIPSDKVSVDRLLNKTSIVNFKDNAYAQLPGSFTTFSNGDMLEAYSDDAFRAGNGSSYDWHSGLLSLSNTYSSWSIWNRCWLGIRRCNLALEYLPQSKVEKEYIDDEDIERYLDEVRILRAWYHFMLIKNFGPLPFIEVAYGPDFDGWRYLERPTYQDITARIVEEIDLVIANNALKPRRRNSGEYALMNMAVAHALKSRVLLYNASALNNPDNNTSKWEAAAQAADACLDAIVPEYSLVPMSQYSSLFTQVFSEENKEIIYRALANSASATNSSNGVDLFTFSKKDRSNNCGSVPTQELIDCFELKDGQLPVKSYANADHTVANLVNGYSEAIGSNPYANRDARLNETILFNGSDYGKMNGLDTAVVIYTYEGKEGTGFNDQLLDQGENFKRLSCTGYYTRKYRTAQFWGANTGSANAHKIYFRLAEVYLNLAEAQCELGKLTEALAALNMVRERAGQPKLQDVHGYEASQDFIRERIRNERRVELCFEGHRYYDQRRWKILDSTNGAITGMKITSAGGDLGPFTYERVKINVDRKATTDKYLILPITSSEIRRLPSLGQPAAWQ